MSSTVVQGTQIILLSTNQTTFIALHLQCCGKKKNKRWYWFNMLLKVKVSKRQWAIKSLSHSTCLPPLDSRWLHIFLNRWLSCEKICKSLRSLSDRKWYNLVKGQTFEPKPFYTEQVAPHSLCNRLHIHESHWFIDSFPQNYPPQQFISSTTCQTSADCNSFSFLKADAAHEWDIL